MSFNANRNLTLQAKQVSVGRMKINAGVLSMALTTVSLTFVGGSQAEGLKKVSFFLTNDLHGHLEPSQQKGGKMVGGFATMKGIVDEIRNQPEYKNGESAFFVLDSGDQFQGTLLSNYDEGKAVFESMNLVGYDAAIPGNHDYDFGPLGWLYDQVTPDETSSNPREVIEGLANLAKFPLLSANTYLKTSLKTSSGNSKFTVDAECKPQNETLKEGIDFVGAKRPSFLKPYAIVEKAGIKVALVGLDHHSTAKMTTAANVSDLCFRDEVETYLEIRKSLEGKADLFVILMHNGNVGNNMEASDITRRINEAYPNGVQLVAAGHTHQTHDDLVNGVHVMQDGAEGKAYGRVDLYVDIETKEVSTAETQSAAGMEIYPSQCNFEKFEFACNQLTFPIKPDAEIVELLKEARSQVGHIANRHLAHVSQKIYKDRINENPLGNILVDALRAETHAEIGLINAGGIRTSLSPGVLTYGKFFEVIPFANQAVMMDAIQWTTLKKTLAKSVQTCGKFGALQISGLRMKFFRQCKNEDGVAVDLDPNAKLQHVELSDGTVLFDSESKTEVATTRTFKLVTLDFLASGGEGFDLKDAKVSRTAGIARELIADYLERTEPTFTNRIDGRMKNTNNVKDPEQERD